MRRQSIVIVIGSIVIVLVLLIIARVGCAYYGKNDKVKKLDNKNKVEQIEPVDLMTNRKPKEQTKSTKRAINIRKRKYLTIYKGRIIDITTSYFIIKYGYNEKKYLFNEATEVYNLKKEKVDRQYLDICQFVSVTRNKSDKKYADKIYVLKLGDCIEE